MTHNRFSLDPFNQATSLVPAGFSLIALPYEPQAQPSPAQWLYQQMYERAQRAHQAVEQPQSRDLFAVMN